MSGWTRAAIAAAVLLLFGAAVATFAPASAGGADCGTWVAPEYGEHETRALLEDYKDLYDDAAGLGAELGLGSEIVGNARQVAAVYEACSDVLSTRRTIAVSLAGAGLVVPLLIIFVSLGAGGTAKQLREQADEIEHRAARLADDDRGA